MRSIHFSMPGLNLSTVFLTTDYLDDVSQMDYIDPSLFYNYLPANRAAIAQQLYNRTNELNPGDITYFENTSVATPKIKMLILLFS